MGRVYSFFSKWTKLDDLLAPYNAAIFERIAASYGRRWMAVAAGAGCVMLSVALAAAASTAVVGVQRIYLLSKGIETQAVVLAVVLDAPTWRGRSEWATVKYSFGTRSGETISDTVRRAPWEVSELAPGKPIALLYVERWPQINLPRFGFRNSSYLAFVAFLCVALSIHLVFFLVRYRTWRNRSGRAAMPPGVT